VLIIVYTFSSNPLWDVIRSREKLVREKMPESGARSRKVTKRSTTVDCEFVSSSGRNGISRTLEYLPGFIIDPK
jgi:hypothetical protein